MAQYSSVRASSWDLDGLVNQLNDKSAEGWSVLSVVNTGSDLAAILVRESAVGQAPAAEVAPTEVAPDITPVAVGTTTLEPVQEPAGWASAEIAAAGAATDAGEAAAATAAKVVEPVAAATSAATTAESAATTASSYGTWGAETVTAGTAGAGAATAQAAQPATQTTPASPPVQQVPTTPAGWYPDPSGRYELRYWDGTAWTEHVSRQGQQFTDPPVA